MRNQYDSEIARLAETYRRAVGLDITPLKAAVTAASTASVIGIGSGGSFTAASLLCNLHETSTGRVSRASTPLEIVSNPTLAASSPVFVISAEGKNPDVVEALRRARRHSARTVHVITNRAESPLVDCAKSLSDVSAHVFSLSEKDGYLATNSLLLDAVVIARTYEALHTAPESVPETLADLNYPYGSLEAWLKEVDPFAQAVASRGSVLVVYSPLLRPVAADLESKLSEAALVHCQMTDLRSFAHGRHLWLAQRPTETTVLAIVDAPLKKLWSAMLAELPAIVPTHSLDLEGSQPRHLLAGLVAEMHFVSRVAHHRGVDAGRPMVPDFGRRLHYLNIEELIPAPQGGPVGGQLSKQEVLGAAWPSTIRTGTLQRERAKFATALDSQEFRAIVFDYDGTLCGSRSKDVPPPAEIVDHLSRLAAHGDRIGVATGRGDSILELLRRSISEEHWKMFRIGLYNCGWRGDLGESPPPQSQTSEFLSHVTRIVGRLKRIGMPIATIRTTHPYQVSVRLTEGADNRASWFTIADAIRQAGLSPSRVYYSKHSVDILHEDVDKSHLIADLILRNRIEPHAILAIGDQGAWPGNDATLLEHRFSLSVDIPSRRLDRGWKLAPDYRRDVDATLWYLERITFRRGNAVNLQLRSHE